jgi:hypothetical protein
MTQAVFDISESFQKYFHHKNPWVIRPVKEISFHSDKTQFLSGTTMAS